MASLAFGVSGFSVGVVSSELMAAGSSFRSERNVGTAGRLSVGTSERRNVARDGGRSGASALTLEVGDRRSDIEQDGSFSSHLSV